MQACCTQVLQAIDNNRHAVLMSLLDAYPLVQVWEPAVPFTSFEKTRERLLSKEGQPRQEEHCCHAVQVRQLSNPRKVYAHLMDMLSKLAGLGLVHCDYNEFNLLVRRLSGYWHGVDYP